MPALFALHTYREDNVNTQRRPAGIYIHIPFCERRCLYCDFLSTTFGEEIHRSYFRSLAEEIRQFPDPGDFRIVSVFFGGGTPSYPSSSLLMGILEIVRDRFELSPDAEITVECNPGTLSLEKLSAYYKAGVNRLSIGLQSADNNMLKRLGRIHTYERFREEFDQARAAGFSNINVDLMYDLPGQDRAMFRSTLETILALPDPPEHISPYSLIIEEGTVFWDMYHEDAERKKLGDTPLFLPSEDEESGMLSDLKEILTRSGYHRYEISNWAEDGFESVHNKGYWERREYIGFGLGASSQIGRERYKNTSDMTDYLSGNREKKDVVLLTLENEMEETMFLGLREIKGVSRDLFLSRFGVTMDSVYHDVISSLCRLKLLDDEGDRIRLTDRGIEISNVVLSEFLLS